MIDLKDFKTGVQRLEAAFGYRMPDDRLAIYYEKLNERYTSKQFSEVVEKLIIMSPRFPTISDFMNVNKHRTRVDLISEYGTA